MLKILKFKIITGILSSTQNRINSIPTKLTVPSQNHHKTTKHFPWIYSCDMLPWFRKSSVPETKKKKKRIAHTECEATCCEVQTNDIFTEFLFVDCRISSSWANNYHYCEKNIVVENARWWMKQESRPTVYTWWFISKLFDFSQYFVARAACQILIHKKLSSNVTME